MVWRAAFLLLVLIPGCAGGPIGFGQDAPETQLQDAVKLRGRNNDAAIAKLLEAIKAHDGKFAAAHFQLGRVYLTAGKLAEAAAEFQTAVEQSPEMAEVQPYIAELALFTPDYDQAAKAYERYIDILSPRDPLRFEGMKRLARLRMMALETGTENVPDGSMQVLSRPKPVY